MKIPVLICGIGGASLGTELAKCLIKADRYEIYGTDISPTAFGHYLHGMAKTFVLDPENYVERLLEICDQHRIAAIIPGGEEPLRLIMQDSKAFSASGVLVAANHPRLTQICSDKARFFDHAKWFKVPVPLTLTVKEVSDLDHCSFPFPWIVKPATGTGGSSFVFLAQTKAESVNYCRHVLSCRDTVLVQEYIDGPEFTIGVLHSPDGVLLGSLALRRLHDTKLSVSQRTPSGIISSGYSQGFVDRFEDLRRQAEGIASVLGSIGPLNIQARLRADQLIVFEINPRFSASCYLRALAGFNEPDVFLQNALYNLPAPPWTLRPGYYLRSLTETYVPGPLLNQGQIPC